MIHLWWLYDTQGAGEIAPETALMAADKEELYTLCGQTKPLDEMTTDLKQITCIQCRIKAAQAA